MRDADPQAGEAGSPGILHPEGRLSRRGDRARGGARSLSPTLRLRIKSSIDVFPAADGDIYLLRSGFGDEFCLERPNRVERATVRALDNGWVRTPDLMKELASTDTERADLAGAIASLEALNLLEPEVSGHLTPAESERYSRQVIYFDDLVPRGASGAEVQANLRASTVVMLGCGGLGSWAALSLAVAGIGRIRLVDDDTVELSNLNRQITFNEDDIGVRKVDAARRALRTVNSEVVVEAVDKRISSSEDVREIIDSADLLIATADWPPHDLPRWVNAACIAAGVPFITAGQFFPAIRVGPMTIPGETACLECLEMKARRSHPLYDELAAHRTRNPTVAATISPASGLAGSMLAMEAVHLLGGAIAPATLGAAFTIDLRHLTQVREDIARLPDCPACRTGAENSPFA